MNSFPVFPKGTKYVFLHYLDISSWAFSIVDTLTIIHRIGTRQMKMACEAYCIQAVILALRQITFHALLDQTAAPPGVALWTYVNLASLD